MFRTGKIYKSLTGIYMLDGSKIRTPGNYYRVDPDTGRSTSMPLRQTNEYIHPSVRARIVLNGPGIEDEGRYEGKALQEYRLRTEGNDRERPLVVWVPRSRRKGATRLPESPLWGTEKELLRTDPNTYDFLIEAPRTPQQREPSRIREP